MMRKYNHFMKKFALKYLTKTLCLGLGLSVACSSLVYANNEQAPAASETTVVQKAESEVFIINAESVKTAFYGESCNLNFSFVERDPNTGLPAATATKRVQSVYLEHGDNNFPFVLTMQQYPAYMLNGPSSKSSKFYNGGTAATWDVSFHNLLVRQDVKSQVYSVNLRINYTDTKDNSLKTEILTAYIDMLGASAPKDAQVLFRSVNEVVPKGRPGQWVPIKLDLANFGLDSVKVLNVTMQVQGSPLVFQQLDQTAVIERRLEPLTGRYYNEPNFDNSTLIEVDYGNFQISQNAGNGIQAISFEITYLDAMQTLKKETVQTYVEVLGGSQKLQPRILIEGFETEPKKIMGGEPFTLTLKLHNTSDATAVSNIRLNISSTGGEKTETAFLPQSGATAYFIKRIAAGEKIDYKLELISAASLNQKAYPLNAELEYQDDNGNSYTTHEQVSLYLNQKVRVDFNKFAIDPDNATVGAELNAYCQLINKGRVSLYNAEIRAPEDAPYVMEPVFLGNIEAGSTKSVDATLRADAPFNGSTKFILHYEDENGNEFNIEHPFDLNVNDMQLEPVDPSMMGDMEQQNFDETNGKAFSNIWLAVIILVCLILLALLIFLYRHIKKKKESKRIKIKGEDY